MSNDPIVVALEPNEEGKHVAAAASRIAASQHRALYPINVVRPNSQPAPQPINRTNDALDATVHGQISHRYSGIDARVGCSAHAG